MKKKKTRSKKSAVSEGSWSGRWAGKVLTELDSHYLELLVHALNRVRDATPTEDRKFLFDELDFLHNAPVNIGCEIPGMHKEFVNWHKEYVKSLRKRGSAEARWYNRVIYKPIVESMKRLIDEMPPYKSS